MLSKLVEYLAINTGVVPTVGVLVLGVSFGIYLYFDSKYKVKLESNHFKAIENQFVDVNSKLNAMFLRIDELKLEDREFGRGLVELKTQFSERTRAMQDNIERLNKKIFNGFRED